MTEDHISEEVLGVGSEELPSVPALDIKYLKDRPIIITQCVLMFLLIMLKYTTQFCGYKFKGAQTKFVGALLICQFILMNKTTDYSKLYYDFSMKILIETFLIGSMFILGFFHLVRLNHFLPGSYLGEYHLIARKILDKNAQELQIVNS